jgi:rhomboid protease GluP
MLRKREGSVLCPSCGQLVGVNADRCLNCGRLRPGMWGFAHLLRTQSPDMGFTRLIFWACGAAYLACLAAQPDAIGGLMSPGIRALYRFGASGALPVFGYGRWWTVLSAAWLHGGLLHILFNMLWVRQLAPATAEAFGAARTVIVYTASAVAGFLLSSLVGHFLPMLPRFIGGASFTVGASAPIFGLLGALVLEGRRRGSSHLSSQAFGYAVVLGAFGLLMPGIDNWAHLGGFAGGYLAAGWLDPRRPERVDHVLAAFACLAASAAAVVASVLTALPALR